MLLICDLDCTFQMILALVCGFRLCVNVKEPALRAGGGGLFTQVPTRTLLLTIKRTRPMLWEIPCRGICVPPAWSLVVSVEQRHKPGAAVT